MSDGTKLLDTAASEIRQLLGGQTALQAQVTSLLGKFAPEKGFKGREYVAAVGEVYAKLLLGGQLMDETHEHDLTTLDGQRLSVKTRLGRGAGWAKSSAIPTIDSPDGPTGLVFVNLCEDYTPKKIWLYDWQELRKADRFKPHIVRKQHRSFVFFVSEDKDKANLQYPRITVTEEGAKARYSIAERESTHWSTNTLITGASERLASTLSSEETRVTIDLRKVQDLLLGGDSPAYEIMEALHTVRRDEGMDGFRGAPRVLGALVQIIAERCSADPA